jgi:hypothetical protein
VMYLTGSNALFTWAAIGGYHEAAYDTVLG